MHKRDVVAEVLRLDVRRLPVALADLSRACVRACARACVRACVWLVCVGLMARLQSTTYILQKGAVIWGGGSCVPVWAHTRAVCVMAPKRTPAVPTRDDTHAAQRDRGQLTRLARGLEVKLGAGDGQEGASRQQARVDFLDVVRVDLHHVVQDSAVGLCVRVCVRVRRVYGTLV